MIEGIDNQEIKQSVWKVSYLAWAVLILAICLLIWGSSDSLKEMLRFWDTHEEYSHGYLIPVITLFLIWQRSDIERDIEFTGAWFALAVVLAGIALVMIGGMTTIAAVGQYGFFIALIGIVASYTGWAGLRPILVPLLFLIFMLPLPGFFLNNLSAKLQLISSEIGVAVIRAFDISVYLEGNVIDLGQYKLQVVEACSGLNYLFPLMSLAFMAAYFFQMQFWKRAVIFLSSIPITILMNSFRIGMIGVLVEYWGIEQAEGFLHDFEGWVIFMACTGVLITEMWLFTRFSRDHRPLREVFGIDFPEPVPENTVVNQRKVPASLFGAVGLIAVSALLATQVQSRAEIYPDRVQFSEFPLVLGDWKGRPDKLEQIYLDALKLDDYIITDFTNPDGARINFYSAYYASQRAGESAHSPRSCLPGGGWIIKKHQVVDLSDVTPTLASLKVNKLVIRKGDYTQLVYYWFPQRGRDLTNEYLVKWYLFWDALTRNRTDGALVRLTMLIGPGQNVSDADQQMQEFLLELLPVVSPYIPD